MRVVVKKLFFVNYGEIVSDKIFSEKSLKKLINKKKKNLLWFDKFSMRLYGW